MLRRLSTFVAATAVALGTLAVVAPAAHASTEESQFTSLANQERTKRGLKAYVVSSDLVTVARRHAQRMAAKGSIYHNPNLGSEVSGWQAVGENVGMGGSASSIHQAFMNSAPHRANIVDTDFTQVGMGTAKDSNGVLYITQVFRQPYGATAAPKPRTLTPRKPQYRPVTAAPKPAVSRPAATPVAKPSVPARRVDPKAELRKRLATARRVAARASARGALGRAVTYVDVMASLAP